jgi:hypothetical protein
MIADTVISMQIKLQMQKKMGTETKVGCLISDLGSKTATQNI